MKKNISMALYTLLLGNLQAEVFVYPVAALEASHEIFVICQKSINDIELYLVDEATDEARTVLWSLYTPAHLLVLPSQDGFSFIDQGIVYIKKFEKRHPRAISIMYPLHNINNMEWIDEYNFLYVAQEDNGAYNIFLSSSTGETTRLSYQDNVDFLYPKKIDSTIFSIIRNKTLQEYCLVQFDIAPQDFISKESTNYTILKNLNDPACFLYMRSEIEGFFLSYPRMRALGGLHDDAYEFTCHHVYKQNGIWIDDALFTFYVLKNFITGTGPLRLYESLERFVPNYMCKDMVLFLNIDEHNEMALYAYSMLNGSIKKQEQGVENKGSNCLSILKRNDCVLTGSIKNNDLRSGDNLSKISLFKFKL